MGAYSDRLRLHFSGIKPATVHKSKGRTWDQVTLNETRLYEPPVLKPDKGLKGGSCNVTACQSPEGVFWFNKGTRKYYCRACAQEINWAGGRALTQELYGTPYLCELESV